MKQYFKTLAILILVSLLGGVYSLTAVGYGISPLQDTESVTARQKRDCPDYQKDSFGNCPSRTHRRHVGGRNYISNGGK